MIVHILKGFSQGISTLHLAKELDIDYSTLLNRRHKMQEFSSQACVRKPLTDDVVEVDEMYQNAGEKGVLHPKPDDPPRVRANKTRGHGTWDTDRPPVLGIVGRESGQIQLILKKIVEERILNPLF
ncbi:MAG: hypothetical protein H6552_00745 [Chitinophagales bacterium]|nr:hypothetical protein [Chitinophagales bacterium]